MAFDTRCPECHTKLRLEEAPSQGEPIECPNCGALFIPPISEAPKRKPAPAPAAVATKAKKEKIFADDVEEEEEEEEAPRPKKKPKRDARPEPKVAKKPKSAAKSITVKADKNPNNKGKKRNVKKRTTNPAVLLASLAFGFIALAGVFFGMTLLLGRAGGVQEMLGYVPADVNWVRGVNVSFMAKFPGYADQVNKFKTERVDAATAELARTSGLNADNFLDYLIIAKNRASATNTGTMYVFRTQSAFDIAKMQNGLSGGTAMDVNGVAAVKFNNTGPGILANSTILIPSTRIVVVILPGQQSSTLLNASAAGKNSKDGMFVHQLNTTSKTVIRGSIWLLIRNTGALQNYMDFSLGAVSTDFKSMYENGKKSQVSGIWTSPGANGVRVGAAMQCSDKTVAYDLVKNMKSGPLGKADESEATNQMKAAGIQFLLEKRTFGEFMQYLEFKSNQDCAYIISTVSGENAKRLLDAWNNPGMGSDEGSSFNPNGFNPQGPAPQAGAPGGIALPGGS